MSGVIMAGAALLSGVLGAMGMGGGGVLIIYLTLIAGVDQRAAQGINLLLFIPCALLALYFYQKKKLIRWKTAFFAAALGLLGAWLGTWLSGVMDVTLLRKIFGGMLLLIGLRELFAKERPESGQTGGKEV